MRSNAEGRGHLAEGSSSVAKRSLHAPSSTVFKGGQSAGKRESKPAQFSTSVRRVNNLPQNDQTSHHIPNQYSGKTLPQQGPFLSPLRHQHHPHHHPGVAMSSLCCYIAFRSLVQTPIFSICPSSFSLKKLSSWDQRLERSNRPREGPWALRGAVVGACICGSREGL